MDQIHIKVQNLIIRQMVHSEVWPTNQNTGKWDFSVFESKFLDHILVHQKLMVSEKNFFSHFFSKLAIKIAIFASKIAISVIKIMKTPFFDKLHQFFGIILMIFFA